MSYLSTATEVFTMDGHGLSPNCDAAENLVYRSVGRQAAATTSEEGFNDLNANQCNVYEYSNSRLESETCYTPYGDVCNDLKTNDQQDTESYANLSNNGMFNYCEALTSWESSPRSSIILDGDFIQLLNAAINNPPDRMDQSLNDNFVFDYGSQIKEDDFNYVTASVFGPEHQASHYSNHIPDEDTLQFPKAPVADCGKKSITTSQTVRKSRLPNKTERSSKSYIALIAKAILSSEDKKLLLKDIYKFFVKIAEKNAPSWKNSVRYSLSANECFVKVGNFKSLFTCKYNYWSIHPEYLEAFSQGNFRCRCAKRLM